VKAPDSVRHRYTVKDRIEFNPIITNMELSCLFFSSLRIV